MSSKKNNANHNSKNHGSKPHGFKLGMDSVRVTHARIANGTVSSGSKPFSRSLPNGDVIVRHREYISDITLGAGTPSAFSVSTFQVNPGQAGTFPWLSAIASRFESYKFNKLCFSYETDAPSTLGGTVVMSFDSDAQDAAPVSKQAAMQIRPYEKGPLWGEDGKPIRLDILREDLQKQKTGYVRFGAQPSGTDIRLYDCGNLFVITQGGSTASLIAGELFVEYEVLLMTPNYDSTSPSAAGMMTMASALVATPFLNAVSSGSIGMSATAAAPTVLNLTDLIVGSEYLIVYGSAGGATSNVAYGTLVGLTQKTLIALSAGAANFGITVIATAVNASITLTLTANSGTAFCAIAQVPVGAQ